MEVTSEPVGWISGARLAVFGRVVRRAGPHVLEASIVPTVLFWLALTLIGLGAAFAVACAWVYGAVAIRLVQRRPVPGLVSLAAVGISVRTAVAVWSGSSFVYFAQPVLTNLVTSALFAGSCWSARPMVARLATDFYPLTPDHLGRPNVVRLLRRLTVWWAAVNLTIAMATMGLLLWLPVTWYVLAKQVMSLSLMGLGVAVTIHVAVRVARREGLMFDPALSPAVPPTTAEALR
ncbi:MAG: VC0807 family protein [Microthrixaceae bacterium]